MMFMLMIMILWSLGFIFWSHPLMLGLILLLQTILMAWITFSFFINFFFSYILFLIMISGMLVLFMYMTSIASNEKFKLNNMSLIMFMTTMLLYLISFFWDNFMFYSFNFNLEMLNNYNYNFNLSKYFNLPNIFILMILMIYLFIVLIATVKIININFGALRQKF